jgi:hypothetical protein
MTPEIRHKEFMDLFKKSKLTVLRLSIKSGVGQQTIYIYKNHGGNMSLANYDKLMNALKATVEA